MDHTAIADACVVGVPDDYSGEVPFAFVSLDPDTAKMVQNDATGKESARLKEDIKKVRLTPLRLPADRAVLSEYSRRCLDSSSPIPRYTIRGWKAV